MRPEEASAAPLQGDNLLASFATVADGRQQPRAAAAARMPRTRAAAEAASARRNVLTDTDLLSLVFEQLDAQSLCRAATVCKKWRATETNQHWRALLASRWPNSVELQDALLDEPGVPAMMSKGCFEHFVGCGTKADFSFELEIRLNCEGMGRDDLHGMALVHHTFYGATAELQPRHTVNGIHGRANHGLEFECRADSAKALTISAQNYRRRRNGDDLPDADTMPIDAEDAAEMFQSGRDYLQVRVTVWYASEHVSIERTFNMELDEDEAATYAATDENDEITIPISFAGLGVQEVESHLTMRLVPEPTETGAEWHAVFDIEPLDNYHFSTTQMLKGIKDKLIAGPHADIPYDDSEIRI